MLIKTQNLNNNDKEVSLEIKAIDFTHILVNECLHIPYNDSKLKNVIDDLVHNICFENNCDYCNDVDMALIIDISRKNINVSLRLEILGEHTNDDFVKYYDIILNTDEQIELTWFLLQHMVMIC